MTNTLFKGIVGAPSLVHTPGERQLTAGGKKRTKLGRAALFNKDDGGGASAPVSATSVHVDTAVGNGRKRKKQDLTGLTEINAKIQKDWAAFDAARAANAQGRAPAAPKNDSVARTTAQALSAAAPHIAGSIGGEAAGAAAGRYIGGLAGASLGPAGALAGAFAGGVAGDYVGRKIADAVFGASKSTLGASVGSSVGGTIGYVAADRLLPGGGALATAVTRVLGTAAGDVAGTRFGGYVAQRVGGVLASTKGNSEARYGSDAALDAGSDLATVGRFSAGAARVAKAGKITPGAAIADNDEEVLRSGGTEALTRFTTMLYERENKQRSASARLALYGAQRPENMQPRHDEPYKAFRQRLNQVLAEQKAGAYPWSTALKKRRRLFEE